MPKNRKVKYFTYKKYSNEMEKSTRNTALLVMDMQVGILKNFSAAPQLLNNVSRAIDTAREKGVQVIYVVVGFRPGFPEISSNNKGFSTSRERFAAMNMDDFMRVHADISPENEEPTITKRRVSAFTGSDLGVVLRAQGIEELILTGIATSGVVLSTTREAADKDYRLTILSDCCGDQDEEVHRVLVTKIFPRQASVLTLDEWVAM